ncbi:MAG: branched-chain amino acid ABC transporter permease [Desulfobacteraceae bacterium]|nr:branched-chain amino acid ABC transporter permease [Desulfobacteraceae bacterium]
MKRNLIWTLWAAGVAAVALFPHLFGVYYANALILFAVWALFAVSLNLLLGFTGLLSFGHAMYFGTGAYGAALALNHIKGLSIVPAVIIGMIAAVILALLIAPLVVRVSGTAFAMLHLAFAQLLYVLALKLRSITGGEDGISIYPRPDLNIFGLLRIEMNDQNFFYFAVIVIAAALSFLWFFTKTPFGQIMVGMRDNSKRIGYLGFKVTYTKAVVYAVSGGFAGLAGAIYALLQSLISTNDAYSMVVSVYPIMMVMLGGVLSYFGPIVGAAFFALIDEWIGSGQFQQLLLKLLSLLLPSSLAQRVSDFFQFEMILGLILVLVTLYWPLGLAGFIALQRMRWQMRRVSGGPQRSAT